MSEGVPVTHPDVKMERGRRIKYTLTHSFWRSIVHIYRAVVAYT